MKTHCPQCHETQRNKQDKSFSVDLDRGLYFYYFEGDTLVNTKYRSSAKHLGSSNREATFVYNHLSGRYFPCEVGILRTPDGDRKGPVDTRFDNACWLEPTQQQEGHLL